MRRAYFFLLCVLIPVAAFGSVRHFPEADIIALWMMVASIILLFMTIPGVAIFYSGISGNKSILAVVAQCFMVAAIGTILWMFVGFSLSFENGGSLQPVIGGLQNAFLKSVSMELPLPHFHLTYITYQMGFALLTPCLIIGAFAERMRFSVMIVFISLWSLLVYYPICHWFWGHGWLDQLGVMDFAGGSVVHVNAGISGLVTAFMLKSKLESNHPKEIHPDMILLAIGAGILWMGWFGFNAGGAATIKHAGLIVLNTQIGAVAGAIGWVVAEYFTHRKVSAMGLILGGITGLVAITPACGYVRPIGSMFIGFIPGVICYFVLNLKYRYGHEDILDAFAIHGVGGILGSILTGLFASKLLGGLGYITQTTMLKQLGIQILSVVVVLIWAGGISFILLKLISYLMGGLQIKAGTVESLYSIDYIPK